MNLALLTAAIGSLTAVAVLGVAAALIVPARTPGRHRPSGLTMHCADGRSRAVIGEPVAVEWRLPAGWLARCADHIVADSPLDRPTIALPVLVQPAPAADPALRADLCAAGV